MIAPRVTLDTVAEPWVGSFPGLGEVHVHADGRVETRISPDSGADAEAKRRHQALRAGWGEPLSWRRRGYRLLAGATVTAPPYDRCVLVAGDAVVTASTFSVLAARDWRFLADRPAPVRLGDGTPVLAYPRSTPVLVPRDLAPGSPPARDDTDAVCADLPQAQDPLPLAGVVIAEPGRVNRPLSEHVRGSAKFEAVLGLTLGGVLAPDAEHPSSTFTTARLLASLPVLRLRSSVGQQPSRAAPTSTLLSWYDELVAAG